MAAATIASWVIQVLRLVPPPVHRALDAWSYRLAQRRIEKRRQAGRKPVPVAPIQYRLKPWRD